MSRLVDGHNVQALERGLKDVRFPALKHDVVHAARQAGVASDVVAMLETLPKTSFESLRDVIDAYGEV